MNRATKSDCPDEPFGQMRRGRAENFGTPSVKIMMELYLSNNLEIKFKQLLSV